MRVPDDHVVGDVGVQRHLVVLGRRVDANAAAGVVRYEVVGDGQQARVLDEHVHHRRRGHVERADAAPLQVVRREDYPRVAVADAAEHEAASRVARHRHVRDALFLAGTCVQRTRHPSYGVWDSPGPARAPGLLLRCPLFFNIDFPCLFHDKKNENP